MVSTHMITILSYVFNESQPLLEILHVLSFVSHPLVSFLKKLLRIKIMKLIWSREYVMKNLCICACPWKLFLLYVHRLFPYNEKKSHEQKRQTVLWKFQESFFINKVLQEGKWKKGGLKKNWDVLNVIRLNAFLKELNSKNRTRNKEFYYSIRL